MSQDPLKDIQNSLTAMENRAKELEKQDSVLISDLLTPSFLAENTSFNSLDDFSSALPDDVESADDFYTENNNKFIVDNSKFDSAQSFIESALAEYAMHQLFDDL